MRVIIRLLAVILLVYLAFFVSQTYSTRTWQAFVYQPADASQAKLAFKYPPGWTALSTYPGYIRVSHSSDSQQLPDFEIDLTSSGQTINPVSYEQTLSRNAVRASDSNFQTIVRGYQTKTIGINQIYYFNQENQASDRLTAHIFGQKNGVMISYAKSQQTTAEKIIATLVYLN